MTTSPTPAIELERPLGPSSWLVTRSVESIGTQTLATDDITHSDDLATSNVSRRPPPTIFFPPSCDRDRDRDQESTLVSPPPQGDSPNNVFMARRGGQLINWPPLQRPIAILPPPPNAPKASPNPTISTTTNLGAIDLT